MNNRTKNSANSISKKKQATLERILQAARSSDGLIMNIAKKAKLDRSSIHNYIKEFPEVATAIEEAKEKLYDTVESKLFEKIKAGDMTAIIFFAKTKMKHRGYIEKQEIEFPKDITLRVVYDDPGHPKNN